MHAAVVHNKQQQAINRTIGWLERADQALRVIKRNSGEITTFAANHIESEAPYQCFTSGGIHGVWKEGGSGEYCRAEHAVGAYHLAKALRIPNVAPAYLLTLQGRLGSIHPWIAGHAPTNATWSNQVVLFDLTSGNPDRALRSNTTNIVVPDELVLSPNEFWTDNNACFIYAVIMRNNIEVPQIIERIFRTAPEDLQEFCDRLRHLSIPALVADWSSIGLLKENQNIVLRNRDVILKCQRILLSASHRRSSGGLEKISSVEAVSIRNDFLDDQHLELEAQLAESLLSEMSRRGVPSKDPMQSELRREVAASTFAVSTLAALKAIRDCPDKPRKPHLSRREKLIDPGAVIIESLVVSGFDHSVTDKPVQDCAVSYHDSDVAIAVIADGFTSADHSGDGAKVLCAMFIQHVRDLAHHGHGNGGFSLMDPAVLGQLHTNMISSLREFNTGHGIPHEFAYHHAFAATILACVVTAEATVILSVGDGFIRINRSTQNLARSMCLDSTRPPSLALYSAYSEERKAALRCEIGDLRRVRQKGGFSASQYAMQVENMMKRLSLAGSFRVDACLPSWHLEHDAITIWSDGARYGEPNTSGCAQSGILPVFALVDEAPLALVKKLILLHNMAADADYFQLNTSRVSRLGLLAELSEDADGWLREQIFSLNDLASSLMLIASMGGGGAQVPSGASLCTQLTALQKLCLHPVTNSAACAQAAEIIEQELRKWALAARQHLARSLPPSALREAVLGLQGAAPFSDDIAVSKITCKPVLL